MRQSLRLGSISGIPIGINWGLLVIAGFYLVNLAVGILPASAPGASALTYWVFALVGVVAFFGSVLAHELGHSIVAQRNGIGVRAITLWLLGGVAVLEREADDPGVEFRIAIAGPAVSIVCAVVFGALAWTTSALVGSAVLTATLGYLALLNLVLAVFNMIPAAPLDGGRVLAAALWKRSNNRHEARARSARVGEVFGTGLLTVAGIGFLFGQGTFVLAILGFFLRTAAGAERRRALGLNALADATVATSMLPIVPAISRGISVVGLEAMSASYDVPVAFPVRTSNGIEGLVPSTVVATIRPSEHRNVLIDELAIGWDQFTSARVNEAMNTVLERAELSGKKHVLIYDDQGRQVGYLPTTTQFSAV